MKKNSFVPVVLILCFAVASCASPPYIHKANEFNRNLHGFSQEPDDISEVTICYSRSNTTAREIMEMASDRCAAYGKKATFNSQDYSMCPLSTPVAALYTCVDPDQP